MELRCQLRFAEVPEGARATLEAADAQRHIVLTIEATGADKAQALALLAERTRDLYGAVCGVVDTVEEVARSFFAGQDDEEPEP